MAFEAGPDGSTKRDVRASDRHQRRVGDRLDEAAGRRAAVAAQTALWRQNADGIQTGDMHGLEVLPDRSAVWASSRLDSRIYGWTLPDLKYIGAVEVGPSANWMTSTPDSRYMYVAISGSDHTVAVDLRKLAIVAKIKTGARPARISTAILPLDRVNPTTTVERTAGVRAMRVRIAIFSVDCRGVSLATCALFAWPSRHRSSAGRRARQTAGFPIPPTSSRIATSSSECSLTDRGGTMPGYAACVMCHTWQTSVRFSLETPATDAGWTVEQSRRNFDVVTKLVNTAEPESEPSASQAARLRIGRRDGPYGLVLTGSRAPTRIPGVLKWIQSLPADGTLPRLSRRSTSSSSAPACSACSRSPAKVTSAAATAMRAASSASRRHRRAGARGLTQKRGGRSDHHRLVIPGNPEQSRFLLKPLHPDGGGSYTHNGPRRWQSRDDPEWQMLAGWVRGERKGKTAHSRRMPHVVRRCVRCVPLLLMAAIGISASVSAQRR